MMKMCNKCGNLLPLDDFVKSSHCKDGYRNTCKDCKNARQSELYLLNQEQYKNKRIEWTRNNPKKRWATVSINQHKKSGNKINFTVDDLINIAVDVCPICGCKLVYGYKGTGKVSSNSPSLDRKFNDDILTPENIWVICHKCNAHKQDKPLPEYVEYCKLIINKYEGGKL